MPSFGCQVRYAHFTTKTPRQKIAAQLFGFAHPPPYSGQEIRIDKKENEILKIITVENEKTVFLPSKLYTSKIWHL